MKRHGHPKFYRLLEKMAEIHDQKNQDYATVKDPLANFKESLRMGIPVDRAILIRISDKFSRMCNLIQKDKSAVKDESIEDTALDMANYALLFIIARGEGK